MSANPQPRRPRHGLVAASLTLAVYVVAAFAGRFLTLHPAYATPLYPAAGVALLSVLLLGPRMIPAVALGAACVRLLHFAGGAPQPASGAGHAVLIAAVVVGPVLQAWIGAAATRRFVAHPTGLSELRDVLRFFLVALVVCLISATVGSAALWWTGLLAQHDLLLNLLIWWTGDLFGVLIFVPIGLAVLGEPRDAWQQRRVPVCVTLVLATAAMAAGIRTVEGWQQERRMGAFERDANSASLLLSAQLRESLQALKALQERLSAPGSADLADIPATMRDWIAPGHLIALGWAPWLSRDEVADLEERVSRGGSARFQVFDAPGRTAPPSAPVVPIRALEPTTRINVGVIGLNQMSLAPSRVAIDAARRGNEPVSTSGFLLPEPGPPVAKPMGVVVFQAVPRASRERGATAGVQPPLGVAFAALRPQDLLRAVQASIPDYLQLCVYDVSAGQAAYRLAGGDTCDTAGGPRYTHGLAYAGRQWELRVSPQNGELPGARAADVWLFALVALGSTAILGGFLLVTTGRARRIETAVRERTAALQAEVTERELAQTALRESEQRFRNILNNVPMGICYTDLRGNVKLVNARFCKFVGQGEAEVLNLNAADFTHPDDRAEDVRLSALLVAGEIPVYRRQKRYVRRDDIVSVQATVTLLRDAQGKARRLVGVVEDVSEHLKLEDAERAREAAEASNRAKSEFLSRMSHELRTPLNAMLGFAQLLELDPRQPLSSTQRPWVAQIQQAGWHLLEMINDVLDLSRIESGNVRLQTEMLSLEELIDSTRAMVQGDADRRGITITQHREGGALNAIGDATRVKQIVTNLLSNAVKYNTDGGTVQVVLRQVSQHTVEISVADSGLGMSESQLAQLFEPFNRLGREKSTLEGTGIGLVISRRLAELMGGELRVSSTAGGGSTFTLALPCENEPDTIRSDFDPFELEPADYHRRIVHYVEDNETNVEVMRGILAQRPQVELEVSITGLDGLAAIRSRRPDLILLDMHLPDISGMELLRHLKSDPTLAQVPVVVVSADALGEQVVAAREAGCAAYLTKPVNIAELLHEVDTLLEELDTRYS